MHRIDTPTAQKDKFGAGKNGFTRGNPQTGVPATQLDDDYCDVIQEEIAGVVESAGITLIKGVKNQLMAALNKLFLRSGNNLSEIKAAGTDAVAAARSNLGLTDVLVGPLAQATGTSTTAIMSQKATTDALATKAPGAIFASSPTETYVFNPNKNLYFLINNGNASGAYSKDFGFIWGFDGAGAMNAGTVPASRVTGLSQTTGASTSAIMSQRAITDALGQNASLGLYQLWHDVTASRAVGSNYSNNSNRPIMVAMCVRNVPTGLYASSIFVQGIEFSTGSTTAGEHRFISVIVPPGQTYSYKPMATSNYTLLELY